MDKKKTQQSSNPSKNDALLDFLGQCFDKSENVWTHCFEFQMDGSIDSFDTSFHKLRSTAGDVAVDLDEVRLPQLLWPNHAFRLSPN
jgi:hypothetical protein